MLQPSKAQKIYDPTLPGGLNRGPQICGKVSRFLSNYLLADIAGSSTSEFWLGYQTRRWMFWMELIPAVTLLLALMVIGGGRYFSLDYYLALLIKGRSPEKAG